MVPALVAAGLALARPAIFDSLDNAVYDTLFRGIGTKPPDSRVVVVDVDERSLTTIGQWPWRRDLMGKLVSRLRDLGASTIALDIVFAEPDRYEGLVPLDDSSSAEEKATPDAALAESLRPGRVVLGYGLTFDAGGRAASACVLHPFGLAMLRAQEDAAQEETPLFRATGAVCNLAALAQAAGASGFMNAAPDSDGILRRVPLLLEFDGRVYPSLGVAAVAKATDVRNVALRLINVNAASLILDNRIVPLDGKSNLLLRFRGRRRTFQYVSAADVLGGQVPDGALRDKIVFVGTDALGTLEVVSTPLDTLFAGVEVQATVADNLLQQDFVHRPQLGTTLESVAALGIGLVVSLLIAGVGLSWGALAGAVGLGTFWSGASWLLSTRGVFLSPLFATAGTLAAFADMTLVKFVVEKERADKSGEETTTAQKLMVQTLLSLVETRDLETGRHSRRTQMYTKLLAVELAKQREYKDYLSPDRIELLSSLAPLHDIGKVGVPDAVLNKPGPLSRDELAEMRRHPIYGRDVIVRAEREAGVKDDVILSMAKEIVYTHHEWWDGTGYPEGLVGQVIPIAGRVMALVDVYDACSTRTLYRPPLSHDDTVKSIIAAKGTHFDPAVVDAFITVAPMMRIVSQETEGLR